MLSDYKHTHIRVGGVTSVHPSLRRSLGNESIGILFGIESTNGFSFSPS